MSIENTAQFLNRVNFTLDGLTRLMYTLRMVNEGSINATHANDYRHNIGLDIVMSDAFDAEYVETAEEVEEAARRERQRVNQFMFDYFYG